MMNVELPAYERTDGSLAFYSPSFSPAPIRPLSQQVHGSSSSVPQLTSSALELLPSQRLAPPHRCAHLLSFSCAFVLLLVVMVVLSSVLVWNVTYSQSQRTVATLTSTFRNDLLHHISDQLTATFNQPIHISCYLARNFAQDVFIDNSTTAPYLAAGFTAEFELLLSLFPNLQSLGIISVLQYDVGMQRDTFAIDQWTVVEGVPTATFKSSVLHYYNFSTPRNATFPANQFVQNYASHWNMTADDIEQTLLKPVSIASTPVDLSTRPIWLRGKQLPQNTVGWTRPYRLAALQAANIGFAAVRQAELVRDGTSPGVVYATTFLTTVDALLSNLYVGANGVTFIVQATGYIVSSSNSRWTLSTLSTEYGEDLVPVQGSPDAFLSAIGVALSASNLIGNYSYNLTGPIPDFCLSPTSTIVVRDLPLTISGSSYHLQAQSLCSLHLDWVIAVLTYDDDFTNNIRQGNEQTGIIVAVVVVSSILFGALLALAVHRPLHRVIRAMNELSSTDLLTRETTLAHDKESEGDDGSDPRSSNWLAQFIQSSQRLSSSCAARGPTLWEVRLLQESFMSMLAALKQSSDKNKAADDAKKRFFRYIFHEVRVPLNAVVLSAQQLRHMSESRPTPMSTQSIHKPSTSIQSTSLVDELEVHELVEVLTEQSQVMVRILNDVLSLQKIEEGVAEWKIEPFSLDELIDGLRRSFALAMESKHISFAIKVNNDDWEPRKLSRHSRYELTSDMYRLRQILSNFLSNAIKFTPDSGSVKFSLQIPTGTPTVGQQPLSVQAAPASTEPVLVRFSITDSGSGLTEEEQQRLFQPYTQLSAGSTDRENVGSGLGLSICRTLVAQQGGTIGVHSDKGHGSTFWFELPLRVQLSQTLLSTSDNSSSVGLITAPLDVSVPCSSEITEATTSSVPAPAPIHPVKIRARLRVMVVEDQTASLKLMAATLRSLGCDVLLARDGVECLKLFNIPEPAVTVWRGHQLDLDAQLAFSWSAEVHVPCDVVLMDNFMPRLSGVKVVRLLRALGVVVPIIGCTGNAMREDMDEFEEAGATSVLSKPINRDALKSIVQQYTASPTISEGRLS